jgi:LysM repeat protein
MKRYWIALLALVLVLAPAAGFAQDEAAEADASASLETYTVQSGDTLFRIAIRFNTTVSAIAAENNIADVTQIFVGQQIRIPGTTATPPSDTGGDTGDSGDSGGDTGGPSNQDGVTYTVVRGDTLGSIARRYNTTFTAIAQANNLSNPNLIFPGQQLVIPGATAPPSDGGGATPTPPTDGGETPAPGGGAYTVQSGDTLASIARRFNTTFTAIAQANGITNPNLIFVGQQLTIPGATIVDGGSTPPPTSGGGNVPPPNTGGSFELGGQVFAFAYPDLMRGTGMTWVKVQVRYNQGDPASIAQGFIDTAKGRGFKVLLSVLGDKDQLAANPTQYYQDFANFLGDVAALNPDGIEVWNEMNIDREWPTGLISGQQYTQMLSAAYQAIKSRNPNVLVISGAPAPTGFFGGCTTAGCDDNFFIRDMANAGAAQFMDCVGVHYNEGIIPPTQNSGDPRGNSSHYSRYYNGMVSLYRSTFPNTPLCFTEIGYVSSEGYGPLPGGFAWAADTSVAEQAQWLADAVRLARNSGSVRLFIIWNVDSTLYGDDPQAGYAIVRPDGTCPACNTIRAVLQ